jgi:multidrug efflux pump subunit AcrA (membrane-fusion protein)
VYKVYTVDKSALHETEVKLGAREGAEVEIVSGVKEGEQVAVPLEGEELRDGAPVSAVR